MRVHTPTSIEQVKRYIDGSDIFSVLIAAPVALALREPKLYALDHVVEAATYSTFAFVVGVVIVIAFNLGKNVRGLISMGEVQSVVLAALSAVSVTALTRDGRFFPTRLRKSRAVRPSRRIIEPNVLPPKSVMPVAY